MPRRSGTAFALLLMLCAAPAVTAHAAPGDTVDAVTNAAPAGDPAFLAELKAAAEQSVAGDSLGAAIAYERLLADPRLATLDTSVQSAAWVFGAQAAAQQKQVKLAEQRMETALEIEPHNGWARVLLAQHQLYTGQTELGTTNLLRGIDDSDGPPALSPELFWSVVAALKPDPARRQALLQGLFDRHWKIEDVEPVEAWVLLATLQANAGQHAKVQATLERIDEPMSLVRLRADNRFDRYLRRDDPRFDPVAAAQRHIDRLRVESMLAPGLNTTASTLSTALLVAGQFEEVVAMTEPLATILEQLEGAPEVDAESISWLLDDRAQAQLQLGRNEDAVATRMLAVRMAEPSGDTVSHNLNLAQLYIGLHRPELAREAIKATGQASVYGEGIRQLLSLRAALQLNDAAAADAARTALLTQRDLNPRLYRAGLLVDNRMDEAAASLIRQLADPAERGEALYHLQELEYGPILPANAELQARYRQLEHRPDVLAALRKVGRVESYPLYVQ